KLVSVTGSADEPASNTISTVYSVSFVNIWGEEGDMSPPSSLIKYKRGQTVKLDNLGDVSANLVNLVEFDSVVKYRLYRLDQGESRFVTEQLISTTTFDDTPNETLGDVFSTQDFVPPPKELSGLHVMTNGVALGFVGKTVYVSEPNQFNVWPHSFPVRSDVVGISSYDNTAVIMTTGYPEAASIYDPRNISPSMLAEREPCVSRHSIVQAANGVIYAAPSGLFYIGSAGVKMLTNDFMDEDDWKRLRPETIHAVYRDGEYYAFHEGEAEGQCYIFDTRESNAVLRQLSQYADCAHVKAGTDDMFVVTDQLLEQFQGSAERLRYRWRSKEHGPGNPVAMTSARALSREFVTKGAQAAIEASRAAALLAAQNNAASLAARVGLNPVNGFGGAINQDVLGGAGFWNVPGLHATDLPPQSLGTAIGNGADIPAPFALQNLTLTIRVIGDTENVDETDVTSDEPYRLNYADRARRWQYELEGEIDVSQFDMAGSQSEMHFDS
ncbi:MAG: hypothetical protein KAG66_04040, partial [Methylococcales bacterium]|nr:hypothetical protein [Methylococcales bacterium]